MTTGCKSKIKSLKPSNSPPIIKIDDSQENLSPLAETVELSDRSGLMNDQQKGEISCSDTVSANNSEWNTRKGIC
jgi:hypothetical protein